MPKLRFTAEEIKRLPLPAAGEGGTTRQTIYYDELQPGLGLRVTSGGARVYVVEGSIAGDTVRVKLGACSDLTLTQARQRAQKVRGELAGGVNPNARKRELRARSVTLAEAFEAFIAGRKGSRKLADRTEYDYRRLLYGTIDENGARRHDGYLSPWRARPLAAITREDVAAKHAQLVKRSGAQANYAMRLLSAVWTFTRAGAPEIGPNPVEILRELKAWVRLERRKTCIRAHELEAWFAAVRELKTEATCDNSEAARVYFQALVLSGHRPGELARLRVPDIDLKARVFTVGVTKNRTDHTLPMSDYLYELFAAWLPKVKGEWAFPGAGPKGHIVEPKKLVAKVREASGVAWTPADCRRTFISIAESLDIPAYALKRLLNHKMANDVTAGYIITDVERLRAPMQKVTDFMLRAAKLRESAPILALRTGSEG
jgi:integrase